MKRPIASPASPRTRRLVTYCEPLTLKTKPGGVASRHLAKLGRLLQPVIGGVDLDRAQLPARVLELALLRQALRIEVVPPGREDPAADADPDRAARGAHRDRPADPRISDAVERAGVERDAVADVQVADLRALEGARRAVVEADADPIADDPGVAVALDVVAGDRAADRARAGHDRTPAAVAELVAEHAAEHAADDRAGARALRALADRLDAVIAPTRLRSTARGAGTEGKAASSGAGA
jgi:hypothetical protein